jgi:hypothetical protein
MTFRSFLGARYAFAHVLGMNLFGLSVWSAYLGLTSHSGLNRNGFLAGSLFLAWAAYWWNFCLALEVVVYSTSLAITTMVTRPVVLCAELSCKRRSRFPKVVILERQSGRSLWVPNTYRVAGLLDAIQLRESGVTVTM